MCVKRSVLSAVLTVLTLAGTASAQQTSPEQEAVRPKVGVGFQSSWPAYGLSGMLDVSEALSGQAVIGFLGGWTTVSGRGLYRIAQRPHIDPYGYGMVGMWRYDTGLSNHSAVSFGGGGGLDVDLRRFAPDLPPLYFNMELGLSVVNLEAAGYNGAWMAFGAGVHYRF